MLAPRLIHPARLTKAILIVVLTAVLVAGASADRDRGKARSDQSRTGAVEHRIDTKKAPAVEHRVDTRGRDVRGSEWWRARPGVPTHTGTHRPGDPDWWRADSKTRDDWRVKMEFDRRRIELRKPGDRYGRYHYERYEPSTHLGTYYYPRYAPSKPHHYSYWVFDNRGPSYCRRSIYFYFGLLPYVRVTRVHVLPYVSISYARVILDNGTYVVSRETDRNACLDETLSDIRDAWIDGRIDLIRRHVDQDLRIAILLDGKYEYSVDSQDFLEMTSDALEEVRTLNLTWESVRERCNGDYTAFARLTFRDSLGVTRTVYVSYTLRRIGSRYVITEAGSSVSHVF